MRAQLVASVPEFALLAPDRARDLQLVEATGKLVVGLVRDIVVEADAR